MISRKKEVRKRRCRSTRGHSHILLSSTGLRRHQPHLFLVWTSKSGWWEIPLRRFGGHPHKFKLSNSNSITMEALSLWVSGCLKPTTATKAQRQEDVYPHVVMNVLPFQRAWGKAKNCQSPWLSEKVWILVERPWPWVLWRTVRIDSVSIAADPFPSLAPFLAKVLTLKLTLLLPNGKFFPRRKVRQFFCRCVLWRLAEVGSLTWLVFLQSVDLLITSSTRAPTICLPVSWVHIGRSTYPGQKKLRQPRKQNYRRVHARESTRLALRPCPSGVRLSHFFWPR